MIINVSVNLAVGLFLRSTRNFPGWSVGILVHEEFSDKSGFNSGLFIPAHSKQPHPRKINPSFRIMCLCRKHAEICCCVDGLLIHKCEGLCFSLLKKQ